uniref:Uncharacterized protein n=1 Tax=Alexandrium monilatum TaxID=311494 RepID=A0A7S4QEC3_9DINO
MGGSDPTSLPFPAPPPFPPSWENRAAYLHWWLCLFMTGVGVLKASGFLRHDLSRLAGLLEFVGGCVFLPRWKWLCLRLGRTGPETSLRLGAWLVLAALGVIVSTNKRKSVVCWSQALCTLELLRERYGPAAVIDGAVALFGGTAIGLLLQSMGHGKLL